MFVYMYPSFNVNYNNVNVKLNGAYNTNPVSGRVRNLVVI